MMKKTLTTIFAAVAVCAAPIASASETWTVADVTLELTDVTFGNANSAWNTNTTTGLPTSTGNAFLKSTALTGGNATLTKYAVAFTLGEKIDGDMTGGNNILSSQRSNNSASGTVVMISGTSITLSGTVTGEALTAKAGNTYLFVCDGSNSYLVDWSNGTSISSDSHDSFILNSSSGGASVWSNKDSSNVHRNDVTVLGVANLNSWEKAQVKSLVPEPATATLSLLALAGLAARRRRK